jgi:hypothetical protein
MTAAQQMWFAHPTYSAPTSDTMAQLNLDAYPFTDLVIENATSWWDLDSSSISSSVHVSGATGSLYVPHTASSLGPYVDTHPTVSGGRSTLPVGVEGFTVEGFVRLDGTRGTHWDTSITAGLSTDTHHLDFSFEHANYPNLVGAGAGADLSLDYLGFTFSSDILAYPSSPVYFFPYSIPSATFVHIALVFDVDHIRVYAAGVKIGEMVATVLVADQIAGLHFGDFQIARYNNTSASTADLYAASWRIVRGALYSADFTPPTAQFAFP